MFRAYWMDGVCGVCETLWTVLGTKVNFSRFVPVMCQIQPVDITQSSSGTFTQTYFVLGYLNIIKYYVSLPCLLSVWGLCLPRSQKNKAFIWDASAGIRHAYFSNVSCSSVKANATLRVYLLS